MADVNMPSFSDLGSMEFMSPLAYQQAQNQIGLAQQFQNQNLAMGQQDLQSKTLANQFSEQSNPLRVQQMGLQNDALGSENTIKGVNARQALALEPEALKAKRQELLGKASDDELKVFYNTAEQEMNSDDPVVAARGQKKIIASRAELERRLKQADELAKIDKQGQNAKEVANIHAGATLGAARIGADSRNQIAAARSGGGDLLSEFNKQKTPTAQFSWLNAQAARAESEGNMELANKFRAMAEPLTNQVNAAYNARGNPNAPDLNAMGVQTAPPVNVAPTPRQPAANQPAPLAVPQGAVDMLKKNPALASKFDEKFGAGAAKRALGN